MARNISLFGLSFTKKLFCEGRDGYIIKGDLKLGNKKIADCFDDGHGGQMEFDVCVPMDVWNQIVSDVSSAYIRIGIATDEKPLLEPMAILVEDLINLELDRKTFMKSAKKKGIDNPILNVFVRRGNAFERYGITCSEIVSAWSNRPMTREELQKYNDGFIVTKVLGSFAFDHIYVNAA